MTKLYAVFGGHLPDPSASGPKDIVEPQIVGLYLDQSAARSVWNGASYATVDDAHQRYFEVALNLAAEPKDVTSIEKHVIEMIFAIGTETQLLQLIAAIIIAEAVLGPAEMRLLEGIFVPGVEASLSKWGSGMANTASGIYWIERVLTLWPSVLRPLIYLRDHEGLRLTPRTVAESMSLTAMASLAPSTGNPVIPDELLEPLSRYLDALPGFRGATDADYSLATRDLHGFAEMQFTRPLHYLEYAGVGGEIT